jgi:putative ATP-dependent endonuclease of the OLD family
MHVFQISIKNFRLLKDVSLALEDRTTVIVGRNNCGKTSLTELFRRILSDSSPRFELEDFSLPVHEEFWVAFHLHAAGAPESQVRGAIPAIEMDLLLEYDKNSVDLGVLSEFIIDLEPDCSKALIELRYQLKDGEIDDFFAGLSVDDSVSEENQKRVFCRAMRDRIPTHFISSVHAVDPNDPTNKKVLDFSTLRALIQGGFINAQRGLDDTTHKDINLLGKVLEALLSSAMTESADAKDRDVAQKLEKALEGIQEGIDTGFNQQLQELLPAFSMFGYPGLSDPRLRTETTLDVQRLLKDHTKVNYAGINGINLPEAYNGLGVRNLVFILLKLYAFFKAFKSQVGAAGIHLIFIEEPEVHLHPQMQEVFVSKLSAIAEEFAKNFNDGSPWPVQFVVTTHSSHFANKAPFDSMRYFLASSTDGAGAVATARIKNLRDGLGNAPVEDRDFLHKYMTLTRCDLLFADKAILIEGTTERLLLPKMVEKLEANDASDFPLSSQYVSVVEVGGAYAHIFFKLLDFLELRTLIITDLDSAKKNAAKKLVSCKVSESTHTSNACIRTWFGDADVSPDALIRTPAEEKTTPIRRLAFQIPETEGAPCGRSFEDAFVLANPTLFDHNGEDDNEAAAWDIAQKIKNKKADFALEYAIDKTDWTVPLYISEGLKWLAVGGRGPVADIATAAPALVIEVEIPSTEASNDC